MTSFARGKAYSERVMQKNVYDKEITEPFLLKHSAPTGFIYPSPSESCDNPYVTQTACNLSYEPTLSDIAIQSITEYNEGDKIEEKDISERIDSNNISAEKDSRIETCVTYCIIGVVILIIIGVIIGIVYFLIEHPKLTHALHKAIEAHKDDKDATPKRITTLANELAKISNRTSTTTFKTLYDDDKGNF